MARKPRGRWRAQRVAELGGSLIILLALLLSGGDIRNFPAVLSGIVGAALALAAIGLGVLVALVLIRKLWSVRGTLPPNVTQSSDTVATPPPRENSSRAVTDDHDHALRRIDWYQFEKIVARLLELEGHHVERRGGTREDGGVDLIAVKAGAPPVLVQCKFWKSWDLDLKTIRELLGARESVAFKARHANAAVYSLSDPSPRALQYARENAIGIVAGAQVTARLARFPLSSFPELMRPDVKYCPKCDAPLVNRGKFWGCSTYGRTRCRGTMPIVG